jgi:hypothetical protein
LVYNIVPQATQTDIINITTKTNKQEIVLPEVCTQKKVFAGPHFWLTKHYLNMVIESGVLQAAPSSPINPPLLQVSHTLVLPLSHKVAAPNPSWLSEALPDC